MSEQQIGRTSDTTHYVGDDCVGGHYGDPEMKFVDVTCGDCEGQNIKRYEDGVAGPGSECQDCGWWQDDDGLDHDPFGVRSKASIGAGEQPEGDAR